MLMAQGVSGVEIAERIGYTVVQVSPIRRRFAETVPADQRCRVESGRKDADPDPESHPTAVAAASRAAGAADPRLPAQRLDQLVRLTPGCHPARARRVYATAHRRRLSAISAAGRANLPRARVAHRARQVVH